MEIKELICIGCPMGCMLTVTEADGQITVTGNTCARGASYAKKGVTNPTRVVTSTVRVKGGNQKMVSVKTEKDIPKDKIMICMRQLKKVEINAPVRIGDVILSNVAGTGVNVVATKEVTSSPLSLCLRKCYNKEIE